MPFFISTNGKYYMGLTNVKGVIVYQEEITAQEYNKYIK